MTDRVTITLENKGNADSFSKRLARVLKYALRACSLKCIRVEPAEAEATATANDQLTPGDNQ